MSRKERERRKSTARRRAETHASGFSTTTLTLPEGLRFYDWKPGVHTVDVIPYVVKKGKETKGGNPFADAGELHFERTFFVYRNIGPEQSWYICPSKTFNEKDFVQEYRNNESKKADGDAELIASYAPKERQIFLFWDHDDPDKGIQLAEKSFHQFGKLLDSRIDNSDERDGWDQFYYPDEDGFSLRLTVTEEPPYGIAVTAIDFIPRRDALPEDVINHPFDLDDLLVKVSYNKLKSAFLGVPESDVDTVDENVRPAAQKTKEESKESSKDSRRTESKPEPKPEPEPIEEQCPYKKHEKVTFKGMACTIVKIAEDGTLTMLDEEDEPVKAHWSKVKPESKSEEKSKKPEPKPEPEPEPVAVAKDDESWDDDWDN